MAVVDIKSVESSQNFGQRMAAKRRAGEIAEPPRTGRKPITEKYRPQLGAMEKAFANALPKLAKAYVDEIYPRDPESCPTHQQVLCCPTAECGYESHRRAFDHKAAAYAIDRIAGKPTARSENSLTLTVVEQLTIGFITVFEDVNGIADPDTRRLAFAQRCGELGSIWGGSAA